MKTNGSTKLSQDRKRPFPIVRRFRESDAEAVLALSGSSPIMSKMAVREDVNDRERAREAVRNPEGLRWVAELDGTIVGMVRVSSSGPHVARICDLRVDSQWWEAALLTELLNVALCHCRRSGVLKVLLDAELAPAEVLAILRGCGFQFSRQRQANGENLLEFYVNLYANPKCEKSNDISPQA